MIKRFLAMAFIAVLALGSRAQAETTNGTWSLQTNRDQAYLTLRWSDGTGHDKNEDDHSINPEDYGFRANASGHVTFKIHHEAGDYALEGWLTDGNGGGNYAFTTNDAYFSELTRRGYDVSEMSRKMTFANLDITMAYVNSIEAAGYHLDANQLITFKALHIDQQYLNDLKGAGITDLSENEVVSLKALKVDANYVRDIDSAGFRHLAARDYVTFKALKIDGAYIKYLRAHGFKNLTPNQVVTMKAMKV